MLYTKTDTQNRNYLSKVYLLSALKKYTWDLNCSLKT